MQASLQTMLPLRKESGGPVTQKPPIKVVPQVQWIVSFPENDPQGKKSFVAVCRGHAALASLLSYLVYGASMEVQQGKAKLEGETVTIHREVKTIANYLGVSTMTITTHMHQLAEWNLIVSHSYSHRYDICHQTIAHLIQNPPPAEYPKKRGVHAKQAEDTKEAKSSFLEKRVKTLEAQMLDLASQIQVLSSQNLNLASQNLNLASFVSSQPAPEAAREGNSEPLIYNNTYRDSNYYSLSAPTGAVSESEDTKESHFSIPEVFSTLATISGLSQEKIAASLMGHLMGTFPQVVALFTPTIAQPVQLPSYTPPKSTKRSSPSRRSSQSEELPPLTLQGRHLLDVYEQWAEEKQVPTARLYSAANALSLVTTSDEEFCAVCTEVRDNDFLNQKEIARDLPWIHDHYDRYRGIMKQKKSKQNGKPPESLEEQRRKADEENERTLQAMLNPPPAYQAHLAKLEKGKKASDKTIPSYRPR